MERKTWVDFVKAVAIYLVVLGHSAGLGQERGLIYAVHVPAFLMISGYLLPRDFGQLGLQRMWGRFLRPYLRLYLFFSALSVVVLAGQLLWAGAPVLRGLLHAIAGVLYGVEGNFDGLGHENAPLWYFTFLCTSVLVLWLALQAGQKAGLPWLGPVILLLLCALAVAGGRHWAPWYLNLAGIGALFLWIGWQSLPVLGRIAGWPRLVLLLLAIGVSGVAIWLALHNGTVNLNRARFGKYPPLSVLCAMAGTLGLCLWGMLVPPWKIWQRLSSHTLVIFCIHIFFIRLTRVLPLDGLGHSARTAALAAYAVLVSLICLRISEMTMPWIRKYVIGEKAAS